MRDLRIELDNGRDTFAPGDRVEGHAVWSLDPGPKSLELSLLWYTSGKGTRDAAVLQARKIDNPGAFGSERFSFTLPPGPYSFSGRLISLIWALELTCTPGDETVRKEIVVSPTGREILLTGVSGPGPQDQAGQILKRILGGSHASS